MFVLCSLYSPGLAAGAPAGPDRAPFARKKVAFSGGGVVLYGLIS